MHIQILNFQLKDLSDSEYRAMCRDLAPSFATVPGLVAKEWFGDPAENAYGGVYHWEDREAMEAFGRTELFHAVATHPNLVNITSSDYEVLEDPTRVTRGLFEMV